MHSAHRTHTQFGHGTHTTESRQTGEGTLRLSALRLNRYYLCMEHRHSRGHGRKGIPFCGCNVRWLYSGHVPVHTLALHAGVHRARGKALLSWLYRAQALSAHRLQPFRTHSRHRQVRQVVAAYRRKPLSQEDRPIQQHSSVRTQN